jgi:peptidoglycan/xylan/chitin deacetylase (PgdA/CDA1 family)
VPVLAYHSIADDPEPWIAPFAVTPTVFARHLDAVLASGRVPITVSQYADGIAGRCVLPERPVLITVDDGFADFVRHALPALSERGICSTLYVTTGALADGGHESVLPPAAMLSSAQLLEIESADVEIGAHSHTHRQMDLIPNAEVAAELSRSARILADRLGHEVRSFAYPHGYWSPRVRRRVSEAGFDSACTVGESFSAAADHRLTLSRIMVRAGTTEATVATWMTGRGARTVQRPRALAFGWRQARRAQQLRGTRFSKRLSLGQ